MTELSVPSVPPTLKKEDAYDAASISVLKGLDALQKVAEAKS